MIDRWIGRVNVALFCLFLMLLPPTFTKAYQQISTSGSPGGITNSAANGVIPMSNGTNLVAPSGTASLPANELDIGPADTVSNGVLGLKGKTSGTATCTAPAVAGTSTNAVVCTNVWQSTAGTAAAPAYGFSADTQTGWYGRGAGFIAFSSANSPYVQLGANQMNLAVGEVIGWSTSDATNTADTRIAKSATGIVNVGTNLGVNLGEIRSTFKPTSGGPADTGTQIISAIKTGISNNTNTSIFDVAIASGGWGGGTIEYCSEVTDGTDFQNMCGYASYAAVNKAGTMTCSALATPIGSISAASSGTITVTFAATTGANLCHIQINSNSAVLVPNAIKAVFTIKAMHGVNTTTYTMD